MTPDENEDDGSAETLDAPDDPDNWEDFSEE